MNIKQQDKMEEVIHDFLRSANSNQIKPFLNSLMSQNCDSFEELTQILKRSQHTFYCNANWETKTLVADCKNCGLLENSCICIRCLLDGNHIQDNHQVYLHYGLNGNCDCGHSDAWDHKGFCKNHQGQILHPEENLPIQIQENMKKNFEALKKFISTEISQKRKIGFFCEIFEYLIQVSKMGDGVLRLASLSFSDESFIHAILTNCFEFSFKEAKAIKTFITSYVSDDLFSSQFSKVIFQNLKDLFTKSFEYCHVQANISEKAPIIGPSSIMKQIFHFLHHLGIEESFIDANQLYQDLMIVTFDFFRSNPTIFEAKNALFLINSFWSIKIILGLYFQNGLHEKIRKFYISLASTFALIEGYIQPFQTINAFNDDSSYYDYNLFYIFISKFQYLSFKLAKKLPFIPEIIETFVDFLYTNDDLDHPSFLYMLHKLAISTLKNAENPKEELDKFIRENKKFHEFEEKIKNKQNGFDKYKNVFELIYHRACLIPINVITQIMLRDSNLLDRRGYPESYLKILNKYHIGNYIQIDLPFLLSLIQFMFSFTEDKNEFLRLIESKFSIFDMQNLNSKSKRMFCFILFVSALILNDPKFIGKKKRNIQLTFMTLLKYNPNINTKILNFYCGKVNLNRAMKWYSQVKFENNWNIILPFISPNDLLSTFIPNILRQMTNDINNPVLLPFPEFINNDKIDLISLMNSTYLYAILYDILYETDEPILYHYVLNLFILLYTNEQAKNIKAKEDHEPIIATSFDEIVNKIPLNFIEFCEVKINYKKGGVYQSLIDLIRNLGSIGLNTLHRASYKRDENEMKQIIQKKSKIKKIKTKIINEYKKKALKFDCSIVKNLATDVKVASNDRMYIFVELLESTIPYFLKKQQHFNFSVKKGYNNWNRTQMKKCLIATTCGHFSNGSFDLICPHCKSSINFLLPNYNSSNDPYLYSKPVTILTNAFNYEKNYLKLLKNMIIILDFRSRLKPEVLQDEMNYLLYRNLYIFVALHCSFTNQLLFKNQKSILGRFLNDFMHTYKSDSSNFVEDFAHNYIEKLQYKEIDYEFLKQVELIRIFYLNPKFESIIDIDEHFSFRNLIKKYNISEDFIVPTRYTVYQNTIENVNKSFDIDKEQLPVFRGIDLPDNFLQIINEPFNIKLVVKDQIEKIICLATGEILKRNPFNRYMIIPHNLSCQPVLIVNGPRINAVGIWKMNNFTFHKSIYRNKKGDEDIGFKNGDPVFLDHESYIDLMDEFISGSCLRKKV